MMVLISLDDAAQKLDIPKETVEQWMQKGLLRVWIGTPTKTQNSSGLHAVIVQRLVDADELFEVAESLGWLQLSAEGWDSEE